MKMSEIYEDENDLLLTKVIWNLSPQGQG